MQKTKIDKTKQYTYKEIRQFENLTQDKFAHIIGISQQQYNKIEQYKVYPRLTTFYEIVKYIKKYGLTPDNIIISNKGGNK